MQNRLAVQDTVVGSPVYSVAVGTTFCGADHELPFHATTDPPRSAARQKVEVGQATAPACAVEASGAAFQGAGSSCQVPPSQSRIDVPTTAMQEELEEHHTPMPPAW